MWNFILCGIIVIFSGLICSVLSLVYRCRWFNCGISSSLLLVL